MSEPFDIDIVYTWVDGNDPEWRLKHDKFTGKDTQEIRVDADCKGRYVDNDELKYSLRSVEKYAPWIHRIYIITDNQIPSWLDLSNPKIKIIDHRDLLPKESLPCYNANVFEHYIFRIPDLSEHFLYANDDTFFNREVNPSTFFASDGYPIMRFRRSPFRRFTIWFKDKILTKPLSQFNLSIRNASRLVNKKYGVYLAERTHHNIDAYLKSSCMKIADEFKDEISKTLTNHLRQDNDIHRSIYSYVPLIEKTAHKEYVDKKTSFMLRIHKQDHYKKLDEYNPIFFCLNDSQYASDDDRRKVREYLMQRFPEKSSFEL